MISYRLPAAADVPAIIELVKASWARTYDPIIGADARKAKSDSKHVPALFLTEIEKADAACMIAECDGRIIGHIGGQVRPTSQNARTFFVDHLHVHPAFHGKGVAGGLMNGLGSAVLAMADWIELTVLSNNNRAIGFYKKHGFEEATGDNEDDGMGGMSSMLMRWRIR